MIPREIGMLADWLQEYYCYDPQYDCVAEARDFARWLAERGLIFKVEENHQDP